MQIKLRTTLGEFVGDAPNGIPALQIKGSCCRVIGVTLGTGEVSLPLSA